MGVWNFFRRTLLRRPPRKRIVLNANEHGFGDAVFTAWIAEGSKGGDVELVHYATGEKRRLLEMLGQVIVDELPKDHKTTYAAYSFEINREKGEIPRMLSRARHLGILSEPKRPAVTISEGATKWANDIGDAMRKGSQKKFVALWPGTVYTSREWPAAHWVDLTWNLSKLGYGVQMMIGEKSPDNTKDTLSDKSKRFVNVPSFQFGQSWDNHAALMRAADLNVAVSSGPATVCGTLDEPCLVLEGPTKDTLWAQMPSIETMRVSKDVIPCAACHFVQSDGFRAACDQGCQALMRLLPEDVLDRIVEKVKELN